MAHLLTHAVAPCISTQSSQKSLASHQDQASVSLPLPRRDVLVGSVFGWSMAAMGDTAEAAARRPPPAPPTEKKDPNVSGVLSKIIASKKRKEAMKQSIARERDKGKLITDD